MQPTVCCLSFFSYAIFSCPRYCDFKTFYDALYNQRKYHRIRYTVPYSGSLLSLFTIIEVTIEKTLQATGNMIFPMLFQLTGAVINIIFDPLLIFGIVRSLNSVLQEQLLQRYSVSFAV